MKTAKELNAIAKEYLKKQEAVQRDKTLKYLEEKIVFAMEGSAEIGNVYCSYHLDAWVDKDIIRKELEQNGYICTVSGNLLKIWWTNT